MMSAGDHGCVACVTALCMHDTWVIARRLSCPQKQAEYAMINLFKVNVQVYQIAYRDCDYAQARYDHVHKHAGDGCWEKDRHSARQSLNIMLLRGGHILRLPLKADTVFDWTDLQAAQHHLWCIAEAGVCLQSESKTCTADKDHISGQAHGLMHNSVQCYSTNA